MEHETNGLVLIFLGETPACRQDGSLRLLSGGPTYCLQDRKRSMHLFLPLWRYLPLSRTCKLLICAHCHTLALASSVRAARPSGNRPWTASRA